MEGELKANGCTLFIFGCYVQFGAVLEVVSVQAPQELFVSCRQVGIPQTVRFFVDQEDGVLRRAP